MSIYVLAFFLHVSEQIWRYDLEKIKTVITVVDSHGQARGTKTCTLRVSIISFTHA